MSIRFSSLDFGFVCEVECLKSVVIPWFTDRVCINIIIGLLI